MLPGFRFLFAAVMLSLSVLIFGLGATALVRATHEELAANPSWRAAPETPWMQPGEAAKPVLAMLRLDTPVEKPAQEIAAPPSAPAAIAPAPVEPEKIAVPTSAERPATMPDPVTAQVSEPVKPEITVAASAVSNPLQDPAPTLAPGAASSAVQGSAPSSVLGFAPSPGPIGANSILADAPRPTGDTKVADAAPPANPTAPVPEAAPAASGQASAPAPAETTLASTKIATLGGPPISIETSPDPKLEKSALKKRLQARRAALRRRMALRAHLARQALLQQQQPFMSPFMQPPIQPSVQAQIAPAR
jgi:hypothetical protein